MSVEVAQARARAIGVAADGRSEFGGVSAGQAITLACKETLSMAMIGGSTTLQQLSAAQLAKAYELEAAGAIHFQVGAMNGQAVKTTLVFAWNTLAQFERSHQGIREILDVS
jgi:hypothetical protein